MNLRCLTLAATLLLTFGLVSRAQAQGAVALLENAHSTLAYADHDYDGHRAMAMREIDAAVHELTGAHETKVRTHAHVRIVHRAARREPEAQVSSDDQLRAAENLLQQAVTGLSGRAYAHVSSAIGQINTALGVR